MTSISIVGESRDRLADLHSALSGDIAADYLQLADLAQCAPHGTTILDVDLGNCNEVQTVKRWLAGRPQSGTVILCVDDATSHHQVTQARALGATAVVQRPLNAARLRDILLGRGDQAPLPLASDLADASSDLTAIEDIFAAARAGQSPGMESVSRAGAQIVDRIQRVGLSSYLSAIRNHHSSTYAHCLSVTAIAAAFGIELGFGRQDQERLAIAGLLHDIGKSQIPLDILEKPGALNDGEQGIMRLHPELGFDMLCGTSGLPEDTLDMVLHHHEYLDGSGYPHRLQGSQISDLNRMITIADVYSALIEPRSYKSGMPPTEAYDTLLAMGPKLDTALVRVFAPLTSRLTL
jgi:putative nucleotidyltransferase with HDIG domain